MCGAAGATVSYVKVRDAVPVRPAALVSLAVMVCEPWARPVGVNDHAPLALAVVVPSTVDPAVNVTVAFGSAVPVSASLAVTLLLPVACASAMVTVGATAAGAMTTLTALEATLVLPAASVAVAVSNCVPLARTPVV